MPPETDIAPITAITSAIMTMPQQNIDTDQIIPARFLTTTTRTGLGKHAFEDWRYDTDGQPRPDFVLNRPENAGSQVLVTGRNFGCGSSREHAPWALLDAGVRVVISSEIADIFKGNSLKNGLVPIELDEETVQWLLANPGSEVSLSIEDCTITLADQRTLPFALDGFARHCLMEGVDEMGFVLNNDAAISAFEETRKTHP